MRSVPHPDATCRTNGCTPVRRDGASARRLTRLHPAGLVRGGDDDFPYPDSADRVNRRPSAARRAIGVIAGLLAVIAWFAAVLVWTSTARVTSASGFADVTVETLQSPDGASALTGALADRVTTFAAGQGFTISGQGEADIRAQIEQVILAANFPDLVGPAIERAREAYQAAPDGPITFDFAALRAEAEARLRVVNPDLVRFIPPDRDLIITVDKNDVPPLASDVARATDTIALLPLWLVLGTIVLGAVAFWASAARARTARWIGIAFVAIALVPLAMRLSVPPVVASFVDAGEASEVTSTATAAVLANWWIALVVSAVIGSALIGLSVWLLRGPARRTPPVVLGR